MNIMVRNLMEKYSQYLGLHMTVSDGSEGSDGPALLTATTLKLYSWSGSTSVIFTFVRSPGHEPHGDQPLPSCKTREFFIVKKTQKDKHGYFKNYDFDHKIIVYTPCLSFR